jgi:uncharacterized protein YecE (DUF72 family)
MDGQEGLSVGTCGFPVRRETYFGAFDTIELQTTFLKVPKIEAGEVLREKAPEGFDFCVKAWQGITHPSTSPSYVKAGIKISPRGASKYGWFQMSKTVLGGWRALSGFCHAVEASIILFQTPASFGPEEENVRNLREFIEMASSEFPCAWEPRGWTTEEIMAAIEGLDVIHAVDPFSRDPVTDGEIYFRMNGSPPGEKAYYYNYTVEDLEQLAGAIEGRRGRIFFNNITNLEDAQRFSDILADRADGPI